jgi:membrane protein implicated in regulation of membrane protease activity
MLIYAAIGAFGLLFLLAMLFIGEVFGGDHDFQGEIGDHGDVGGHDAGPSIFSARIMASFLTAFGVGGVVARYYGLSHPLASGCGVVSGMVLAGVVYEFAKVLYSQQASSEIHMAGLLGKPAEVTIGIPSGGVGQVSVAIGGERTTQIARSKDGAPIAPGSTVVITALRGESVVVENLTAAPSKSPGGAA